MKRIACLIVALTLVLIPFSAFAYEELSVGSKGEDVKALQERLIELGYLTGAADGAYGKQTKAAVERFQGVQSLEITGVADENTQEYLFSDDAPEPIDYKELDYEEICRNPDNYEQEYFKFNGKVLQVIELGKLGDEPIYNDKLKYGFRIATKGNYDNVVYVEQTRLTSWPRVLEGDKGTFYVRFRGIETFDTVIGGKTTLPRFIMDEPRLTFD